MFIEEDNIVFDIVNCSDANIFVGCMNKLFVLKSVSPIVRFHLKVTFSANTFHVK